MMLGLFVYCLLFVYFPSLISSCHFDVKVKQVLLNEGFHRNITYGIVFNHDDGENMWIYKNCILGLDQTLPSGIYTNPDELSDFRRINKLNAIPKNRINVELPAEQAHPNSVYIMGKVVDNKVYLWLPVHARYHKAVTGGGTARNEIGPPKLYLRCPDQRLDVCGKAISTSVTFLCNGSSREKCSWKEIPYKMMTESLKWDVPVGNLNHYYSVALGTGAVIITGSLYLLKAIHEYKVNSKEKKL